jgi:hypothetical protein
MNINDFNSKVNLPRVIAKLGGNVKDFDFIRMPVFGWYAKSKTSDFIGNIFEFFEPSDWANLYTHIVDNFEDCLDFKLPASENARKKLFSNYMQHMQYQAAWLMSKQEIQDHRARYANKVMYFKDILNEVGMPALVKNEVGYLSERVIASFEKLELGSKRKYQKVLVIPSFNTPKHICSFELSKYTSIHDREKLYTNAEVGWYGRMNGYIAADFNELKITQGSTWNYKSDFWTPENTELSEGLNTSQLIQIWGDAKNAKFAVSPAEMVANKQGTDEVEHHVASLSYPQVEELQRKLGKSLMEAWIASKENQFTVLGKTFVRRGNAYYVAVKNQEELISNFAIEITHIAKRKKGEEEEFWWCGFLQHNLSIVPFEMNDKYFTSCYLFAKGIRKQFLSLGLGIPYINERYVRQLLSMIQLTAYKVEIKAES